ncbi:MAG: hypothetical protein IMW89_04420 [Ktedonobacteraceae bacterium]|nr:hypothetical protein [Ktedonobacteraceae bacterium]
MLQEYAQQKNAGKTRWLWARFNQLFSARSGMIAYVPIIFVAIIMFWGVSWLFFWPTSDPARYQCYALTFWLGSSAIHLLPQEQCAFLAQSIPQPPFRMFPLEYPPLTLLPFSLALFLPLAYYQFAFALLMSLVAVLIYWLLLRYGPQGAAFMFAFYLFIGAIATSPNRFDLIPAALTLICLIAAERRHWTTAYVALAFGVLMKLYPLLLLPALFIAEQQAAGQLSPAKRPGRNESLLQQLRALLRHSLRWRWKNSLVFAGIVIGITTCFALLNFQGAVLNQLDYFADRPIQVEATGSTILWLARNFFPFEVRLDFGSYNITSLLSEPVSHLSTAALLLGILYILWQQWHSRFDITQGFIALLLVSIATGKVFSPQYLIWLIPLLAYAGAFEGFWLVSWGIVSLLTMFIYSFFYSHLLTQDPALLMSAPGFFESIAIRNAFFVLATLAYLFNWFQARQRKPLHALSGKTT